MTAKEKMVLEWVRADDDGRGLPAEGYWGLHMFDAAITQNECEKILDSLVRQGYLKKVENWNGKMLYTLAEDEDEQESTCSNFFSNYQEAFRKASEDQIIGTATQSMYDFIQASGMKDSGRIFQALIMAATLGIASETGRLNEKEKKIAREVFGEIYNGDMEKLYGALAEGVMESQYSMMELFCNLGHARLGIPLLKYILSFAYIDGKMSSDVADRLDPIFGTVLMEDFFHNGPVDDDED